METILISDVNLSNADLSGADLVLIHSTSWKLQTQSSESP